MKTHSGFPDYPENDWQASQRRKRQRHERKHMPDGYLPHLPQTDYTVYEDLNFWGKIGYILASPRFPWRLLGYLGVAIVTVSIFYGDKRYSSKADFATLTAAVQSVSQDMSGVKSDQKVLQSEQSTIKNTVERIETRQDRLMEMLTRHN